MARRTVDDLPSFALRNIACHSAYSDAEWARICAVVATVRREQLSDIERDALRITADDYLRDLHRQSAGVPTIGAELKAWAKVSKLIEKLQQAIVAAADIHQNIRDNKGELVGFMATREMEAALFGLAPPAPSSTDITVKGKTTTVRHPFTVLNPGHTMSVSEVNALLSQIKFQADIQCPPFGAPYCWTFTGRREARVPYMQQILWLWTHRFGGKLTLSVDSSDVPARVYGPLVDYVAAVADPIMKEAAPKPSALRDILERQKKFYTWLSNYQRKYKTEIGPWAYNRAVAMRERNPYGDVAPQV